MFARIRRNIALLKMLEYATPQQCEAILATATDDLVAAIAEIAQNTLKGQALLTLSNKCVEKEKEDHQETVQ